MIAPTLETSDTNDVPAPLSTGNKIIPLPKGRKRRTTRGEL